MRQTKWKPSAYQLFPDEWFCKVISETTFEFLYFEPLKRKQYDQYGGIFQHYVIDLNHFTKEEQEKSIRSFGLTMEDETVTNALIAECMCEENLLNVPFQEYFAETIDDLNQLLKQLSVNFKAELNVKGNEVKRITFKEV